MDFDPRAQNPGLEVSFFENPESLAEWVLKVALDREKSYAPGKPHAYRLFYFIDRVEYSRAINSKVGEEVDITFYRDSGSSSGAGFQIGISRPQFFPTVTELAQKLWQTYTATLF